MFNNILTSCFVAIRLASILMLYLIASTAIANEINSLNYTIVSEQDNFLNVELNFKTSDAKHTFIFLPNEWAGNKNLYFSITKLKVTTSNTRIVNTTKPNIKKILHQPNSNITIKYRIRQLFVGPPSNSQQARSAIIQKDFFHAAGNLIFVFPHTDIKKKLTINLNWKVPDNWKIANTHGINTKNQNNLKLSLYELLSSLYSGGDINIIQNKIGNSNLWISIKNDDWLHLNKEKFANSCIKIIRKQRDFWEDHTIPNVLITVTPVGTSKNNIFGTALLNSFELFYPLGVNFSKNIEVPFLISHENFHTWNSFNTFKDNHKKDVVKHSWFTEGVTDYYANRTLLQTQTIKFKDYVARYNKTLIKYYFSPYINYTNYQITKDYWKHKQIRKLSYYRGQILAHNWNTHIRIKSNNENSFDTFMKDLIPPRGSQIEQQDIISKSINYTSGGFSADIENYIFAGKQIKPHPKSLGPCCTMQTKTIKARVLHPSKKTYIIQTKDVPQFAIDYSEFISNPDKCIAWIN